MSLPRVLPSIMRTERGDMIRSAVFVLAALAVVGVLGGRVYDEKEDAIQGVGKKYDTVAEKKKEILNDIEKAKKFDESEQRAKAAGQKNRDTSKESLNEEKLKTTKTAIAKGKPASAIECILKVALEGEKLIPETYANFEKILAKYKETKTEDFDFAAREVELIMSALEALKGDAVKGIEAAKSGYLALKNEFVKKAETAEKQLSEIEKRVSQVNIKEDHKTLEQQNLSKNKEVVDTLSKKFLRCVS